MKNLRLRSVVLVSVAVLAASTVLTVAPAAAQPGDQPGVDLEVYTGQVDPAGVQMMRELGWMRRMSPEPTPGVGPPTRSKQY